MQHLSLHYSEPAEADATGGVVMMLDALEDGVATAERIRQHLEEAVIVAGEHEIQVTTSIGLAVVDALHPPETALQQADEALYAAKNSGRNRVSVWEPAFAGSCIEGSRPAGRQARQSVTRRRIQQSPCTLRSDRSSGTGRFRRCSA